MIVRAGVCDSERPRACRLRNMVSQAWHVLHVILEDDDVFARDGVGIGHRRDWTFLTHRQPVTTGSCYTPYRQARGSSALRHRERCLLPHTRERLQHLVDLLVRVLGAHRHANA